MERNTHIILNERELTTLQVGLQEIQQKEKREIEHLKEHNADGTNTSNIRAAAKRMQEIDTLWDKLWTALTILNQ